MIFHGVKNNAKECKLSQRTYLCLNRSCRQEHLQLLMGITKFAEVVHGRVRGMHVTCLGQINITEQGVDE